MKRYYIKITLFLLLFLITSCTSHTYYSDKGWFKKAESKVSAEKILDQAKYKMIYLDVSDTANRKLKQDIEKFGNNLEKYGDVIELAYLPKVEKKIFLNKILALLGKSYDYYDSPFLVFFTEGTIKNSFKPYYILPLGGIHEKCVKNSLNRIEKNIHKKNVKIFTTKEFYKLKGCSTYENNKQHAYSVFKLLSEILLKAKLRK